MISLIKKLISLAVVVAILLFIFSGENNDDKKRQNKIDKQWSELQKKLDKMSKDSQYEMKERVLRVLDKLNKE